MTTHEAHSRLSKAGPASTNAKRCSTTIHGAGIMHRRCVAMLVRKRNCQDSLCFALYECNVLFCQLRGSVPCPALMCSAFGIKMSHAALCWDIVVPEAALHFRVVNPTSHTESCVALPREFSKGESANTRLPVPHQRSMVQAKAMHGAPTPQRPHTTIHLLPDYHMGPTSLGPRTPDPHKDPRGHTLRPPPPPKDPQKMAPQATRTRVPLTEDVTRSAPQPVWEGTGRGGGRPRGRQHPPAAPLPSYSQELWLPDF